MNETLESRKATRSQWRARLGPAAVILTVWLVWAWPQVSGQWVVGFRDSAYLYYPYFQWIDTLWESGDLPLWNPYCDLGYPIVGDGSSSVFYPGKLVFLLRSISYPARYGLYISFHVLLAAIGTYRLARQLRAPPVAATIAAVSFAFGGSVLFQATNVIYLVSGSLLPFAIASMLSMRRSAKIRYPIGLGTVLALMILGGDPQMAYMVLLIAGTVQLSHLLRLARRLHGFRHWLASGMRRCRSLVVAIVVVLILGAVQIFPLSDWTQASSRKGVAGFSGRALLEDPAKRSGASAVYQFSQPPWTVGELIWPNISGHPFPIHQRWAQHLPGADRMWTPSLYVGLTVLLFGFASARLWGLHRRQVRLTWIGVVFALGSFGWYGGAWFWNELAASMASDGWGKTELGAPVGGMYWAMVSVLPKFYLFRYPAKLFVIASLMLCLLAGIGIGKIQNSCRMVVAAALVVVLISSLGLVLLWQHAPALDRGYVDALFGPLDVTGATKGIAIALCHSITMAILLAVGTFVCVGRNADASWPAWVLLALAMIDLSAANHRLVPLIDAEQMEARLVQDDAGYGVVRTTRPTSTWNNKGSERRLEEIVAWQRRSLYPKHHLGIPTRLLGSFSSVSHPDNEAFTRFANQLASRIESASDSSPIQVVGVPGPTLGFQMTREQFQALSTSLSKDVQSAWAELFDCPPKTIPIAEESTRHYSFNVSALEEVVILWMTLPIDGWQIEVGNQQDGRQHDTSLFAVGSYAMAVRLPPGKWHVQFCYTPRAFWWGAGISFCGWLGLLVWIVRPQIWSAVRQRKL